MIDIHTHILPGMDDGSASLKESLSMARESARQGVRLLAATPHFYATRKPPKAFAAPGERNPWPCWKAFGKTVSPSYWWGRRCASSTVSAGWRKCRASL